MKQELKEGIENWFKKASNRNETIREQINGMRIFYPLDKDLLNERVSKIAIKLLHDRGFFNKQGVGRTDNQARVIDKGKSIKLIHFKNKSGFEMDFISNNNYVREILPSEFLSVLNKVTAIYSEYHKRKEDTLMLRRKFRKSYTTIDKYRMNKGIECLDYTEVKIASGMSGRLDIDVDEQLLNYDDVYEGVLNMIKQVKKPLMYLKAFTMELWQN